VELQAGVSKIHIKIKKFGRNRKKVKGKV